jgi:hypothetical protein
MIGKIGELIHGPFGRWQERPASPGQFNNSADAPEQGKSQLYFQRLDLITDRGLRNPQVDRSTTEITFMPDGKCVS